MSLVNRSLVMDEIEESSTDCIDFDSVRYLSIGNNVNDLQPTSQVVQVSGTITVSF